MTTFEEEFDNLLLTLSKISEDLLSVNDVNCLNGDIMRAIQEIQEHAGKSGKASTIHYLRQCIVQLTRNIPAALLGVPAIVGLCDLAREATDNDAHSSSPSFFSGSDGGNGGGSDRKASFRP